MSLQGVGAIRFWGFSPAVDLLEEAAAAGCDASEADESGPQRFLMVSPGDARHVLKTLAGAHARRAEGGPNTREFEANIFEKEPEVLARHALLLAVALDFELPRRERAELLLELWANSLLREKTALYLATKARELSRMVSEDEGPLAPLIDVSALKMKDRDRLEEVFRSWGEDVEFEIVRLRDERLRTFYKTRYEHRASVLDWDFTWELTPIASIVHKIHFRDWRMSGVLFEVRGSAYVAPNRTMASYASGREKGGSVQRRGFWADVANGPFAAMGVTCDDQRLTDKKSDRHTKSSNDIAYYTVLQWLCEIETGKRWGLKQEDIHDFEYGASVKGAGGFAKGFLAGGGPKLAALEEAGEAGEEEEEGGAVVDVEEEARAQAARSKASAVKFGRLPPFKLRLLSGDWGDLLRKPRHQSAFSALTLGTHVAYVLADPRVSTLLRPKAAAIVETAKFLVELGKKPRADYAVRLHACAIARGWSGSTRNSVDADGAIDGIADAHFRYLYDAETAQAYLDACKDAPQPAEPLQLTDASEEAQDEKVGAAGPGGGGRPTGTAGMEAGVGCLQIVDRAGGEEGKASGDPGSAEGEAAAAAKSAEVVALPGGGAIGGDGKAAAELAASSGGKVCVITGLPAKYKDPLTGLPYANLEAYKELRKRHPDPNKPPPEEAAAASEADGAEPPRKEELTERLRPILTGGMSRRVNKAVP